MPAPRVSRAPQGLQGKTPQRPPVSIFLQVSIAEIFGIHNPAKTIEIFSFGTNLTRYKVNYRFPVRCTSLCSLDGLGTAFANVDIKQN